MSFPARLGNAALALVLLSVLSSAAASAQPGSQAHAVDASDGYEHERRAVADGVWALVQPKFFIQPAGNVTLIEQKDGFIVIDAGGSPGAARRVIEHVRALGPKPIKAVVITHWHGDHPQGLAEIVVAFPKVRTISTAVTRRHLQNPKTMNSPATPDDVRNAAFLDRLDRTIPRLAEFAAKAGTESEKAGWLQTVNLFKRYRTDMDGALTIAPNEGFELRLLLDDPERPVELLFLGRANTDGDAVAWLPKQRVLVSGDIVVSPIPFGFGSYPKGWVEVLKRISAMDVAVLVPGHGEPQRDSAYLNQMIALIEDVRAQVGLLARQGLSLDAVRAKIDLAAHAKLFAGDDPWLNRWFQDYWVSPITQAAYKEAKGEPVVQSLGE